MIKKKMEVEKISRKNKVVDEHFIGIWKPELSVYLLDGYSHKGHASDKTKAYGLNTRPKLWKPQHKGAP